MEKATKTAVKLANKYRTENNYDGGVIVLYQGKEAGWMNELRDPQHWMPGCIAVDINGQQWIARGGNDHDGATEWRPLGIAA